MDPMYNQQKEGLPVCANCGAVCGSADKHCKYCGASLDGVATIQKRRVYPQSGGRPQAAAAENAARNTDASPAYQMGYQRAKRYPGHEKKSTVGTLAVLSLVFGVLSVLFLIFTNHFGLLAIAGLILGIAALVKHEHVILSVLGVIFSGFVLLIGLFWFVLPFFYYF